MAIISQETWDNMSKKVKEEVCAVYDEQPSDDYDKGYNAALEELFGKENLQPKPKTPKIWLDILNQTNINDFKIVHPDCDDKLSKRLEATYKIKWLIELGYGGMVTDEEWRNEDINKFSIVCEENRLSISCLPEERHFISFHSLQQAEEFMSYPENVELVKMYNQI